MLSGIGAHAMKFKLASFFLFGNLYPIHQIAKFSRYMVCSMVHAYLVDESTDQLGLKEVAIRNPVEESEQGLQCCPHKGDALGVLLQLVSCKLHGNTRLC